ncbi:MAG: histidine kinase [bacterium]
MNHPVFLNKKSISVYFGLWILLAGIHFSIFYFLYGFTIEIAAADSLTYNFLFCIIGILMWYIVRYSIPDKSNRTNVFINHLTFLALILVFWNGIPYLLLNYFFGSFKPYRDLLSISIPYRLISGTLYYAILGMAYYLIIYYSNLQEKLKTESRLREILKETELNMLKSQINPHFLFNSLNSISSLTITNPEKAREMVIKLSDFLRYSVSMNTTRFTNLENELLNIQRYLEIEKVRFGEKLQFEFKIEGTCTEHKIPLMLLQPLFENAIKHGVYESTEQVKIEMDCYYKSGYLEIVIMNDFDPNAHPRKGTGLGLKNIRERLRLLYKTDTLLKTSVEGTKFFVFLSLPNIEIKEPKEKP